MRYIVEINFDGEKHCLRCPLRNNIDDSCKVQPDSDDIENWDDQLKNCPLMMK